MKIRICFRGDDRNPQNIFLPGFRKRGQGSVLYRRGNNVAGDIEPSSAVCVSARISAAAMFPLKFDYKQPKVSDTYIYVVGIDTNRLTNTHQLQVRDGMSGLSHNSAQDALWPLYAHELALPVILGNQIIAAVKCTRTWHGDNWASGAIYELHRQIIMNPGCNVPQTYFDAAIDFLQNEVANHRRGTTPKTASGYHQSTRQ